MILEEARIGEAAFSSPLSDLEIDVFFTLSPDEVDVICDRRGDLNRLGLALHLCVVKMTGRAELSAKLVPHEVLTRIAGQLGLPVPDLASLRSLYQDRTTLFRHRKLAIDVAGFREAGAGARSGLLQYLRQEILSTTAPDVLASKTATNPKISFFDIIISFHFIFQNVVDTVYILQIIILIIEKLLEFHQAGK
jgi:hypothetical protein